MVRGNFGNSEQHARAGRASGGNKKKSGTISRSEAASKAASSQSREEKQRAGRAGRNKSNRSN